MIKLLLVEDDESLAYIEKTGLEDIIGGYEVTTAANGQEGVKAWEQARPDVIISDLSGRKISEGTIQNILRENSAKSDEAYEEIRKRIELSPVVGADETGAAVGKQLHWNWIFQTDALTYAYQMKSRGQKAIDSKFPKGLPNSTLVTDRHQSYFKMNVKDHQVCLAHLLRNAEYLNELDTKQDWSRRFIHLDDFAKIHSIAETAMKNGNSKFNAILAVVQQ